MDPFAKVTREELVEEVKMIGYLHYRSYNLLHPQLQEDVERQTA